MSSLKIRWEQLRQLLLLLLYRRKQIILVLKDLRIFV